MPPPVRSAATWALALATFASGSALSRAATAPLTCGATITRSTTLTRNLGPCAGVGVVVGRDGITLDLHGHTILGSGDSATAGVEVAGRRHVTVRGGTIDGFREGVVLGPPFYTEPTVITAHNRILHMTLGVRSASGIAVYGYDKTFDNRIAHDRVFGSIGVTADRTTVADNVLPRPSFLESAIDVSGSRDRIVRNHVTLILVTPTGGTVAPLAHDVITGNTVRDELGVYGSPFYGPTVTHALVARNRAGHIELADLSHTLAIGNIVRGVDETAAHPLLDGIVLAADSATLPGSVCCTTAHNALIGNTVTDGAASGIFVAGPSTLTIGTDAPLRYPGALDTLVLGNVTRRDGQRVSAGSRSGAREGIDNEAPTTALGGNRADDNFGLGIESVPGVRDLGGNEASGNGDARQCVDVSCH